MTREQRSGSRKAIRRGVWAWVWGGALLALLTIFPLTAHAQMAVPSSAIPISAPAPGVISFDFAEGLAGLQVGQKYGYIDKTGATVILVQFDAVGPFALGLAPVEIGGKWGYIDPGGSLVIPLQFDGADGFSALGLAATNVGGKWGFIDRSGTFVIPPQFDDVDDAHGGTLLQTQSASAPALLAVEMNGQWGYSDATGHLVIAPRFDNAHHFTSDGVAAVVVQGKWGFIDPTGAIVVPIRYDDALANTSEGLAAVKSGSSWGYVTVTSGAQIIMPRFDDVDLFIGGLAPVEVNGEWGYVNRTGMFVIPPQFADASRFVLPDVTFVQTTAGTYELIDRKGSVVSGPFEDAGDFAEGLARVQVNGKVGFVDHTGALVIPPQFAPDPSLV